MDHAFDHSLGTKASEHPLLFSEVAWCPKEDRERLTEIFFEKYQVPAYFAAKDAVLSAFFHGKQTALVVSSGPQVTRVVPVSEGYVLKKGIVKQNIGGDHISEAVLHMMQHDFHTKVIPQYQVASKEPVEPGHVAKWTERHPQAQASFHHYQQSRVLDDFKESVLSVFPQHVDDAYVVPFLTKLTRLETFQS